MLHNQVDPFLRLDFSTFVLQVVGLTASIGVEKAKNIPEAEINILKICSNLDAVCISMVKKYEKEMEELVPVPKEGKSIKRMM